MNEILQTIQNAVIAIGFIPNLIILAILGLYLFWSESHTTRKNRNSVFDIFLLVIAVTIIWGRFSYILSNPADFEGLIWSLAPYEKYSDGIYYFRLLPWKYFKIWDGGFLFISMYVAFTTFAFFISTFIKKWRWREMIGVVTVSGSIMLGLSLIITGVLSENRDMVNQGLAIAVIYLLYRFIHMLMKLRHRHMTDAYEKSLFVVHFSYFALSNGFILASLLSSEITVVDRYHLYALVIYVILSVAVYIYDMQRKNIVIDTVFRSPKLPKVGSTVRVKREGK